LHTRADSRILMLLMTTLTTPTRMQSGPTIAGRQGSSRRVQARGTAGAMKRILLLCVLSPHGLAAAVEHEYTVRVSPDLARMQVEARYSRPPAHIEARASEAGSLVSSVLDCERGHAIETRNRRLLLPAAGLRCLRYSVDLDRAARGERHNRQLAARARYVSPSRWLWRPRLDETDSIRVRFELPEGIDVAVPWTPVAGANREYLLTASPESANAAAIFGRFAYHELPVGDANLRVVLADGERPLDQEAMLAWLTATATDVSLAYGRFPNPAAFVLVLPVSAERRWSDSPVPFGRVVRDGGEAVELFVDPVRPLADYLGDWTATHEFSHLMLPYLDSEARWISEGFAQYYQNVLLARAGAYDEATAWKNILAGLERGRAARPELSPNAAAGQRRRGARMKVYWSGAALALMADVTLRERSDGAESLDTVLDRLQTCCLPSTRTWTGPEFFAALDELIEDAVFMPLYRRYADRAGFPDVSTYMDRLGVVGADGAARIDPDAPLGRLRRNIMRRNSETAAWRRGLAVD
jgi:hypothetical protein